MTLEERLLAFREIDPVRNCWNWTRSLRHGYGQICVEKGVVMQVHRLAYCLWVGGLGDRDVCHRCDNPRCFNPDHLFAGTHAENMADAKRKGRMNVGENNHFARLTWRRVRGIRAMCASGIQNRVVARRFKVSEATVSLITQQHIWKEEPV